MKSDLLQINNYEMEDISLQFRNSSMESDDLHRDSRQKFDPIVAKDVFDEGMKVINQRIENLANKLKLAEQTVINNNEAIFNLEMRLKNEALGIEIPKNFMTNDTVTDKTFSANTYYKVDGKSVNQGNDAQAINVEINSGINRTNLGNINNSNGLQQNTTLNDYTGNRTNLNNINNGSAGGQQELRFQNVVDNVNLTDIKN